MWRVAAFVCVAIGEGTDSGTYSDTDFCSVLVYRRLRGVCAFGYRFVYLCVFQ